MEFLFFLNNSLIKGGLKQLYDTLNVLGRTRCTGILVVPFLQHGDLWWWWNLFLGFLVCLEFLEIGAGIVVVGAFEESSIEVGLGSAEVERGSVRKMAGFPCRSFSRGTATRNNNPSANLIWRRRDISSPPLRCRTRHIPRVVFFYTWMFLTGFCKSHTDRKDSCFLLPLSLNVRCKKWTMHQRRWIYSVDHLVAYPITTKHGAP